MCSNVPLNMKTILFLLLIGVCMVHLNTGTLILNETSSATTVKKRSSYPPSRVHLTQSERNRRLIPYANYYIAGNQETNAHDIVEEGQALDYTATTLKPKSPIIVNANSQKIQYDYVDYHQPQQQQQQQQSPISGYDYVPVAYIPGNSALPFLSNSQYYSTYYQGADGAEDFKLYTTARPKYSYTTTTLQPNGGGDKSEQLSYFGDYHLASTVPPQNAYLKYFISPPTRQRQPPTTRKPAYSPVLFSTPQSDYLNFHYSDLYRAPTSTSTHANEPSSTTPVVEITSPKNYIVPQHVPSVTPATKLVNTVTTTPSYSLAYEYPEAAQFAYSAPLPPSKMPKAIPVRYDEQQIAQQSTRPPLRTEEYPLHKTYQAGPVLKTDEYSLFKTPAHQTELPLLSKPYEPADTDLADFSVDDIFRGYNLNKKLPDRITPENIKESIRTLSYMLQMLQKADSITQFHKQPNQYSKDILDSLKDSSHSLLRNEEHKSANSLQNEENAFDTYDPKEDLLHNKPDKNEQSTPGRAGIDYPIYSVIPQTSFTCKTQRYKGFFADPDTKCQVWHYCDLNGGQASFLCPNGTIFSQAALTCDWWFNVKCASTAQLYVLNERLYKYIIPIRPSFPEDFSGPLVDQYLTEKFKETESQRKYKYPTNSSLSNPETTASALNLTALSEYDIPSHLLNENL